MKDFSAAVSEISARFTSLSVEPEKATEYYLNAFNTLEFPCLTTPIIQENSGELIMNELYKGIKD